MSLILCRLEPVNHPFEVAELGVRLYSSQELSYVIYQHPLLVIDDFVDDALIKFIRTELDMEQLAEKLVLWQAKEESSDDLLLLILQESHYYSMAEISRYKKTLLELRRKPAVELKKARADYLFSLKQYGKAIALYEKVLSQAKEARLSEKKISGILCSLAAGHARMFQHEEAYAAYSRAQAYEPENEWILGRIYCLKKMFPKLELSQNDEQRLAGLDTAALDEAIAAAREKGEEAEMVMEIEAVFKKDGVKRLSQATQVVHQWKKEYRAMV